MMDKFIEENINNIWLTSDHHFFHKRIQEYAGRPDNWQDLLINNWLEKIKPEEYVLHLGDFALGTVPQIRNLISILTGKIILLLGNHDRSSQLRLYKKEFFMIISASGFVYKNYIFTHRPIEKVKQGFINIHGHIHQYTIDDDQHINICVEQTNYYPVKLKEVINGLENYT